MTVKGGTSQACAACKYQRRKCAADCQLAPYFPPDQPKQFQNAHKLFGVRNILRILKPLDPNQRAEAMSSIMYQANVREKYPVQGCVGVIYSLRILIERTKQELEAVLTELAKFQRAHQQQLQQQQLCTSSPPPSQLALFNPSNYSEIPCNNNVNPLWVQQSTGYSSYNKNNPATVDSHLQQHHHSLLPATAPSQEYDEICPFFDTIDDRQSYMDSKEAYESSSESSLKDTTQSMEHVSENELKSAAACFSLTNVVN